MQLNDFPWFQDRFSTAEFGCRVELLVQVTVNGTTATELFC